MARYYDEWPRYVPVAERRRRAREKAARLRKAGRILSPVEVSGVKIARTFWGEAWCKNLELYSDYANRLPRGRTYVRNGSVLDLQIESGSVRALVNGSSVYDVEIRIESLEASLWQDIKRGCAGKIGSLVELLQGKLSKGVMEIVTQPREGLFPEPRQIALACSCPDWAVMCKHVAATLYGIGARLDHEPDMLFTLRGVDPSEMVESAVEQQAIPRADSRRRTLADDDLSSIFGVEIEVEGSAGAAEPASSRRTRSKKKAGAKKAKASTTKKRTAKKARATTSASEKTKGASATKKKVTTRKAKTSTTQKKAKSAKASPKKKAPARGASAGRKKLAAKGSKTAIARKKKAPTRPRR